MREVEFTGVDRSLSRLHHDLYKSGNCQVEHRWRSRGFHIQAPTEELMKRFLSVFVALVRSMVLCAVAFYY
jgi:hypothetical protein